MARKLRLEYPGAIYHVMNRGDRREPIFHDEADRQLFVDTFNEELALKYYKTRNRPVSYGG